VARKDHKLGSRKDEPQGQARCFSKDLAVSIGKNHPGAQYFGSGSVVRPLNPQKSLKKKNQNPVPDFKFGIK
jgi:hypothetical protein